MPAVSVIVPVYQAARFIERCIHSLFRQTLHNIEYIIIDDASTDGSLGIIRSMFDLYPHRRPQTFLLRNETNRGVAAVRQAALEYASGEFVIHCDADDYFEPDALSLLYEQAITNKADIVICGYYIHQDGMETQSIYNPDNISPERVIADITTKKLHAAVWNKLIRRDYITQNGIAFPYRLNVCEDLIFTIHALLCQPVIAILPQPLYHYDRDINSASLSTLDFPHDAEQVFVWMNELQRLPLRRDSLTYRNEMTHIAYWALRHNIFDESSYRRIFRPFIPLIRKSRQKIYIRILTEAAARGLSIPRRLFAVIDALNTRRN